MNIKIGNLMDHIDDYNDIFITANGYIKSNGMLVMGRGFALQVNKAFKEGKSAASYFGQRIISEALLVGTRPTLYNYNLLLPNFAQFGTHTKTSWGLFQVKLDYSERASLELISKATIMLREYANLHTTNRMALNYPGIGNGKLDINDVAPILTQLPHSVDIWKYK